MFTVASVTFQFPATILVRRLGPRIMFAAVTVGFGLVTLVSALGFWMRRMLLMVDSVRLLSIHGSK